MTNWIATLLSWQERKMAESEYLTCDSCGLLKEGAFYARQHRASSDIRSRVKVLFLTWPHVLLFISIATSMQHSKSFASFAFSYVDSDKQRLIICNQPRQRASLDNLVIPGRTRIPSHKSEEFDCQVARNLLKSSMTRSTGPPPYTAEPPPSQHHNLQFPEALKSSPTRNSHGTIDTAVTGESIYRIAPTPSPKTTARNRSLVPVRRSQRAELVSGHRQRNNNRQPSSRSQYSYDGAHDYMNESRMTSSTWSTVSKVNNSIITDFSSGSRELTSAKYCSHYNEIATKLGLPKLSPLFTGEICPLSASAPSNTSARWKQRNPPCEEARTKIYETWMALSKASAPSLHYFYL